MPLCNLLASHPFGWETASSYWAGNQRAKGVLDAPRSGFLLKMINYAVNKELSVQTTLNMSLILKTDRLLQTLLAVRYLFMRGVVLQDGARVWAAQPVIRVMVLSSSWVSRSEGKKLTVFRRPLHGDGFDLQLLQHFVLIPVTLMDLLCTWWVFSLISLSVCAM